MRRFNCVAVVVALIAAGPGAATTFAQTPTWPPSSPSGPSGPAKPSRLFDGTITQAGKRWAFWITTSERGWFLGESGNAAFGFPRGVRCSTDGRAYRWRRVSRALNHFSMSRVRPRRDGTFRYRYRFRHRQDRRITVREDLTGRFSEAGTALTMRYRRTTTKPGQRCSTGWVRARASLLRYTGTTPEGVTVEFDVKNRMTLMTGELVPNLEGSISGVVPGCKTSNAEFPTVAKRWTGVSGHVDEDGAVQLSTELPIPSLEGPGGGAPPPHPAGFFLASGLPEESDRYFPWATGPAQLTGRLVLSWVGTDEGCESTRTQVVLQRTHPELALTLPRPGTKQTHGARYQR